MCHVGALRTLDTIHVPELPTVVGIQLRYFLDGHQHDRQLHHAHSSIGCRHHHLVGRHHALRVRTHDEAQQLLRVGEWHSEFGQRRVFAKRLIANRQVDVALTHARAGCRLHYTVHKHIHGNLRQRVVGCWRLHVEFRIVWSKH